MQKLDELCVGSGEVEIWELVARDPAKVLDVDGFGVAGDQAAVEEAEADGFFGVGVGEIFDELAD